MKVRLQDIVKYCLEHKCEKCIYCRNGDCLVNIDGFIPCIYEEYYWLCGNSPELAKALYTNEEVEL